MTVFIVPTSQVEHLAKSILAKTNDWEVIFPNLNKDGKRYFPDGEVYVKIPNPEKLKGGRVIVLHSGAPRPNEGLIELELILQILRDYNPPTTLQSRQTRPKKEMQIELFFTYFPYGMQDKVFEKGETNVAENLIEKLINYYKVRKIYTIDAHFWGRKWVKKYPIVNISALPLLLKRVGEDFGEDVLFLSPDLGEKRRAGFDGFQKKRIDSYQVEIKRGWRGSRSLRGRTVGIVDDLLETGGTLIKAYNQCKKQGAKEVIALVTHGVLPKGITKVKKNFSKLYLTNTIKRKEANIDITDLVLKTLSR